MAAPSKGLSRGLGALLGAAPTVSLSRGGGTLPVALMQAGAFQPRREIRRESLDDLAASIRTHGVIEPIVVRPLPEPAAGGARYEIVAGERRWRAAQLAGLSDIPAIVRTLSDQQAVAVALIENIQREELTAAEEARALKRLTLEFSLTQQEVADSVGRSRAAVSNLIRLLELPEPVLTLIDENKISMGHARALLGIEEAPARTHFAQLIVERELSVRQTEELVRKGRSEEGRADQKKATTQPVVSEVLKTASVHVQLHQKSSGTARIVVDVADAKTRDTIVAAIKKAAE